MATLAEIRAKLQAQENRSEGTRPVGDNAIYPFWNLEQGKESTVRFLPDGDDSNTFFWAERLMIKLPFAGVKGETDSRPVQVQIPCMEMYGESCPILNEVRGWFKDPSLEDMGRKYWKKRSYIFQGFVTEDGLREETTPENPIRRFIIGPQIFQLIKSALVDPELEELPTDYVRGVDFKLVKTSKGGYADYSTSKWSRRETPLTESQLEAVNSFGLFNLTDFLPKKPGDVELQVMQEMFQASVDGEAYDPDRWSQYFRPAGMAAATGDPAKASAPTPTPTPVAAPVAEDTPPFTPDPAPAPAAAPEAPAAAAPADTGNKAEDILAMIRNRQSQ
jgi:hypothetical protein